MRHSVALATDVQDALTTHLLRPDGQEDLCFAIWQPSSGATRCSALISQPLMPEPSEREVHGTAGFNSRYFPRAIAQAQSVGGGIALLHSHPAGRGWQSMSEPDIDTEHRHAPRAYAATGLPFVGMTLAGDRAWSARFWQRVGRQQYERESCVNVPEVGRRLSSPGTTPWSRHRRSPTARRAPSPHGATGSSKLDPASHRDRRHR